MGPVDWNAAIIAPLIGSVAARLVLRHLTGQRSIELLVLMGISAVMMAHMYARIGAATLAVKWWLYPMQAGGLALAFVIPAMVALRPADQPRRALVRPALAVLAAYLAMAAVFWVRGL